MLLPYRLKIERLNASHMLIKPVTKDGQFLFSYL